MKYSAEELSMAGDRFLGRKYEDMDCQEFVEHCLQEIGLVMDLKGSNAWYRKMTWTGSPEECRKIFGEIPKGAFLFIHAYDGGEEKRGYHDGKGNASHIGIKTGRSGTEMVRRAREAGVSEPEKWNFGDGAIHSSSTRGHVATSTFRDKSISGGWNRIGLWDRMDYGKTVNWVLEHMGIGGGPEDKQTEEDKRMMVTVSGPNGERVNLRKKPDGDLLDRIPDGTEAELLESGDTWCKIKVMGKTGWMKTEFLVADDSAVPDEDFGPGDVDDQGGSGKIGLYFTAEELGQLLPVLESAVDQIVAKVGRG